MGQRKGKKKGKRNSVVFACMLAILLIMIILAIVIYFSGREKNKEDPTKIQHNEIEVSKLENVDLGNGLQLIDAGRFSGTFVEDGSDDEVEDVFALTLKNTTDSWLEYANITISDANDSYSFSVSALPSESTVRVLEMNRKNMPVDQDYKITSTDIVFYQESPSLCSDVFETRTENQNIIVKNISDQNISNDIYVYFKSKQDDVYIGGIAYRVRISGGIEAGEEVECSSIHFIEDSSEILFLTYAD